MQDREVVLYTRENCCLCNDAKLLLERYGLEPELVDIDRHPDKLEKYNECVPVVEIDGKVHFRGKINEVLLRRILRSSK